MFESVNFFWLLKLITRMGKLSGFIFITFDVVSSKIFLQNSFIDWAFFCISMGFSISTFTYSSYYPAEEITKSFIVDFAVQAASMAIIWFPFFIKLANAFKRKEFFQIISNFNDCHTMVRCLDNPMFKISRINIFFISAKIHGQQIIEPKAYSNFSICFDII